ncbi:MAG: HAD family hydrolase [Actinobacteria bacterium]|nr:HAD family hydrolase [Thermoleophilia bacterium]MCB9010805.1 HAD family hydrolase [Actinomycetota bacterium]
MTEPGLDPTRVQAVLFDVDGTLRDTDDELTARLMARLPSRLGPVAPERLARTLVCAAESTVQRVLALADRFDLDGPVNRAVARVVPGGHGGTRLTPHARDALQGLSARYRLGVVSAGPEIAVANFLDEHDLTGLMDVVVSGLTFRRTKPHPEPVLGALKRLGVPPEGGVMVGDVPVDVRAGRAAGVQTVGVLTGFAGRRELERAAPDLIVDDLSGLTRALTGAVPA